MPEQLGLEQVFRQRAAVHRHQGRVAAGAGHVQGPRGDLLAGSGLAGDEDRRAARAYHANDMAYLPHFPAFPDQQALPLLPPEIPGQTGQTTRPPLLYGLFNLRPSLGDRWPGIDMRPAASSARHRKAALGGPGSARECRAPAVVPLPATRLGSNSLLENPTQWRHNRSPQPFKRRFRYAAFGSPGGRLAGPFSPQSV